MRGIERAQGAGDRAVCSSGQIPGASYVSCGSARSKEYTVVPSNAHEVVQVHWPGAFKFRSLSRPRGPCMQNTYLLDMPELAFLS